MALLGVLARVHVSDRPSTVERLGAFQVCRSGDIKLAV